MPRNKSETPDNQPSPDSQNISGMNRRVFLAGSVGAAIAILFGSSDSARAQSPTPCSDDPACADLLMDRYRSPIEFADEELKLMQKTQENLYRFFLNPSFLMYIEMTGKQKVVDEALKLAIQNPGALHYREESAGVVLITPRPSASPIPDGFLIKIERSQISEVQLPGKPRVKLHPDGWRDWKDMRKVIAETTQYLWDNTGMFSVLTKRERLEIDYYNFKLPHRLKELVELRNKGIKLKPEENIGRLRAYREFTTRLANLPVAPSHEDMRDPQKNVFPSLYIHVSMNQPGFIEVWDPAPASLVPLMYFTHEGYIAGVQGFDPNLSPDYENAIADRQKKAQNKTP